MNFLNNNRIVSQFVFTLKLQSIQVAYLKSAILLYDTLDRINSIHPTSEFWPTKLVYVCFIYHLDCQIIPSYTSPSNLWGIRPLWHGSSRFWNKNDGYSLYTTLVFRFSKPMGLILLLFGKFDSPIITPTPTGKSLASISSVQTRLARRWLWLGGGGGGAGDIPRRAVTQ